jgi:hypothetical protein
MSTSPTIPSRRIAIFDVIYLGFCLLLFGYGVLTWRGIVGDGHPWRPISFVSLSGAMLLQSLAPFAHRRSRAAGYTVLGASLVALACSTVAR